MVYRWLVYSGSAYTGGGNNGYLDQAHKYFYYVSGSNSNCETLYDFANRGSWNTATWSSFYECVNGSKGQLKGNRIQFPKACNQGGTLDEECLKAFRDKAEEECRSACYAKRYGYIVSIVDEYVEAGYQRNNTLKRVVNPSDANDYVTYSEIECMADKLVAHCMNHCDLSLVYDYTNTQIIRGVGTQKQADEMKVALTHAYEVSVPGLNGGSCGAQFETINRINANYYSVIDETLLQTLNFFFTSHNSDLSQLMTPSLFRTTFLPTTTPMEY